MISFKDFHKTKRIPGRFDDCDIIALSIISSTIKNGIILELGSLHGRTSFCLSKSSPTSRIFCLDYWDNSIFRSSDEIERPNSIDTFKSNTIDCPNITPVQLRYAFQNIPLWNEPPDMVFIGTSYTNPDYQNIIDFWLPNIKTGGVLCGYNYYTIEKAGVILLPDINENVERLEQMLNQKTVSPRTSSVWSFTVS